MKNEYKAMVLSCIDPRFQPKVYNYLKKKKLIGKYSSFSIAGSAIGVTSSKFRKWHLTFWQNLETSIKLHKIKNLMMNKDSNWGLSYTSVAEEGTYLSLSHYPPKTGFMAFHKDNVDYGHIFQFMVNLTSKDIDYNEGGLHLIVNGKKIDVDKEMKPGSVLFFDGAHEHGVTPVQTKNEIGRIAFFSIPCSFLTQSDVPQFVRNVEKVYFGVKRRLNKLTGRIKAY